MSENVEIILVGGPRDGERVSFSQSRSARGYKFPKTLVQPKDGTNNVYRVAIHESIPQEPPYTDAYAACEKSIPALNQLRTT